MYVGRPHLPLRLPRRRLPAARGSGAAPSFATINNAVIVIVVIIIISSSSFIIITTTIINNYNCDCPGVLFPRLEAPEPQVSSHIRERGSAPKGGVGTLR